MAEPDIDSDFDYEESAKKKKKKAMAKATPKVWKIHFFNFLKVVSPCLHCCMILHLFKLLLLLLSWQTPSTRGRKKQIPMNYDATDTEKPYSCESELLFLSPNLTSSRLANGECLYRDLTPLAFCPVLCFIIVQLVVHVTRLVRVWLTTTRTRTRTCWRAAGKTKTRDRPPRQQAPTVVLAWPQLPPLRSIPCTVRACRCPPMLTLRQVGNSCSLQKNRHTLKVSFFSFSYLLLLPHFLTCESTSA